MAQTDTQLDSTEGPWYHRLGNFVWQLIYSLFEAVRALLLLVFKTPFLLLPSAANTSPKDEEYNTHLIKQLRTIVNSLKLDQDQRFVVFNWVEQIEWTNERALRERDAHEVIRWWQIILSVMIPVLSTFGATSELISAAGIVLAVLTGVYQFRRPEDRWRHYRTINEQYLGEMWDYFALSGEVYLKFDKAKNRYVKAYRNHEDAFPVFNMRMRGIAREDITKFFSAVVPSVREAGAEEEGPEEETEEETGGSGQTE